MMLTLVPTDRIGNCIVRDKEGRQTGTAFARPSASRPGYVTIITDTKIGKAFRVPADWVVALELTENAAPEFGPLDYRKAKHGDDRTVHARDGLGAELVRYNRAGKWYVEFMDGTRMQVNLTYAVRWATRDDVTAFLRRPGGQAFDAAYRRATGG